jgi:antitoxin component of MazEF toxin-antitoxin module
MPRFQSRLVLNNPNYNSLRTVVPHVIVGALGLEPGDSLEWELTPGRLQVMITKSTTPGRRRVIRH